MSEEVQTTEQPVEEQTTEQPVVGSKQWVGEDGALNRDAFGELGEHSLFDKIKSVDELAKAYINVEKFKGQKVEDILASEDAEIKSMLLKARGVPNEASGYEFSFDIPEALGVTEDALNQTREKMKELNIPKDAAEKLVEWDIARSSQLLEARAEEEKAAFDTAHSSLAKEWKNDLTNNTERTANALAYLGMEDLAADVRDPQTEAAVKFTKAIHDNILPLIENDEIIEARQNQSIATTKDRMDDLRSEMQKLHEQGKSTSPEYQKLITEMTSLTMKIT